MKIAIISSIDVLSNKSWSGTLLYMHNALVKYGHEVIVVKPESSLIRFILKVANFFSIKLFGIKINHEHSVLVSKELGFKYQRKLKSLQFDLVFAPGASTEIAFMSINKPVVYLSDVTFPLMVGYYPEFTQYNSTGIRSGCLIETRAIQNSSLSTFPSIWALESASNLNNGKSKINHIPWGANLDFVDRDKLNINIKLSMSECQLLFVGVDWFRKGGAIAIEIVSRLRDLGINATLNIVGIADLDKNIAELDYINNYGKLNKAVGNELDILEGLFSTSHFLLLPTQSECYGMVFAEAAAFGLPSLSNNTGGVPSAIIEGLSGHTINYNDTSDYIDIIESYIHEPTKYYSLRMSSRSVYENILNWSTWAKEFSKISEDLLIEDLQDSASCRVN